MKPIVLIKKNNCGLKEYYCEITKMLDEDLCQENRPKWYRNYIYDTRDIFDNNTLVIRFPGMTTGYIRFDDNNIITECKIEEYTLKDKWCHYVGDVNEKFKQFVGRQIVFNKENN